MSSRTLRALTAATLFLSALSATASGEESGSTPCEDAAWRIYNSCLVSANGYWDQLLCDYSFRYNMHVCTR